MPLPMASAPLAQAETVAKLGPRAPKVMGDVAGGHVNQHHGDQEGG